MPTYIGSKGDLRLFSQEELNLTISKLSRGSTPSPDGVPNEAVLEVARVKPTIILSVMNTFLRNKIFLKKWKVTKLVLLLKGPDKLISEHFSFRPISMLDTSGKLLGRLIFKRFNDHLDEIPFRRAINQYSFRKRKSTTYAIDWVMEAADEAGKGIVQNHDLCAFDMLQVRNAFNSAP